MSIKILDSDLLDSLAEKAKDNPRLRQHCNLHDSYEEPSHRLLNAMEPGSYLRPHRHFIDAKPIIDKKSEYFQVKLQYESE